MKSLFTFALALASLTASAQALTNTGDTLYVETGGLLYIDGAVQNQAGSWLQNEGTLQLTGDLTNAGTLTSAGTLSFTGDSTQQFTPGTASVDTLQLRNTGSAGQNLLHLLGELTVARQLTLQSGLLRTAAADTLWLPDGATLVGEDLDRYVQGNLRVTRESVTGLADLGVGVSLDATGQDLGWVSITRTAGLQLADTSYSASVGGIDRIWTLTTQHAPTQNVPLVFTWLAADDNLLTDLSKAQLWQRTTGPWSAVGATTNVSTRNLAHAASTLGTFTIGQPAGNPLPVELVAFTAERRGADAVLRWTTAQERHNAYFAVEVSPDGRTFREVGKVAGQGTATQATGYTYTDRGIGRYAARLLYYRLRQVDQDGRVAYSVVRTVAPASASVLAVYPNPSAGAVTLVGAAAQAPVQVFDAVGRLVHHATTDAAGQARLQVFRTLPKGVYLIRSGAQVVRLVLE